MTNKRAQQVKHAMKLKLVAVYYSSITSNYNQCCYHCILPQSFIIITRVTNLITLVKPQELTHHKSLLS